MSDIDTVSELLDRIDRLEYQLNAMENLINDLICDLYPVTQIQYDESGTEYALNHLKYCPSNQKDEGYLTWSFDEIPLRGEKLKNSLYGPL